MTTPTVSLHFTVQQGATFRAKFQRFNVPVDVVLRNGALVYKTNGRAVPDTDKTPVDYTGCTAQMVLSCTEPPLTFSTDPSEAQGRITLGDDGMCELHLTPAQTAALTWERAAGPLDVTFSNGDVERHFYIELCLERMGGCHG